MRKMNFSHVSVFTNKGTADIANSRLSSICSRVKSMAKAVLLQEVLDALTETDVDTYPGDGMNNLAAVSSVLLKRNVERPEGMLMNVIPEMEDEEFRQHFRISRRVFEELVRHLDRDLSQEDCSGGFTPLTVQEQILIFLWYISNQASMRGNSMLFDVSKSTVHKVVHRVAKAICDNSDTFIKWPNAERQQLISDEIEALSGLHGCIGFLDGTHIRIINAPGQDPDYINRKGFPSLQLQVVVDDLGFIMDAYVGWPGATHDARVLRNSQLFVRGERGDLFEIHNSFIIGDTAYPLKNWLITPFKDNGHLSAQQRRFNKVLSSRRQVVERVIGHVKCRFRLLRHMYCVSVESTCQLIIAACCLHNLCLLEDGDIEEYVDMSNTLMSRNVNDFPNVFQNAAAGIARRMELVNSL